jgi:prepilin-type N-terminal cleavage/methylation domain-containing protein
MQHTIQKKIQYSYGFTLIEVLVAVAIFATSLMALVLTVGTGIGNVNVAKEKITANYLAQEGIEMVRYERDFFVQTNPTSGWASFTSLLPSCTSANPCGVSAPQLFGALPGSIPAFTSCPGPSHAQCQITQNPTTGAANGAYGIAGVLSESTSIWTPTVFTRYIYFETPTGSGIGSGDAYVVHSVVTWVQGTGTHTVEMRETLFNWY